MTSHFFLFFEAKIIHFLIKFSANICKLRMHMRAETQENYIIPDANISRITWSAPKLNYDLPERIKKNSYEENLS